MAPSPYLPGVDTLDIPRVPIVLNYLPPSDGRERMFFSYAFFFVTTVTFGVFDRRQVCLFCVLLLSLLLVALAIVAALLFCFRGGGGGYLFLLLRFCFF